MVIESAVWRDADHTEIVATIDGITSTVPAVAGNADYAAILAWVAAGNAIADTVP